MLTSEIYERNLYVWESNHIEECIEANILKGKNVLEVGGILPKTYVDNLGAKSWTSIDIRAKTVKNSYYEVIKGDICEYGFGENIFDTIISTNCFEHINNLEKALTNMYKLLKPGGYLSALFGPIWSSSKGNHIWLSDEGKYKTFNDNIIPDWAHLLYSESKLRELIKDMYKPPIVEEILDQTYHSSFINRIFYEDYIELLNNSPFIIHEIRNWHKPTPPCPKIQKILEEKYEGRKNFKTISIKVLLQKKI